MTATSNIIADARQPAEALPVIALGGGVTLAAVLAILHRAGIATYAVCNNSDFAARSRWYRKLPGSGPDSCPANLHALLESSSIQSAVLLPCADDWAQAVAALPPALAQRFPSSSPPLATIETMVDKWRFAELLQHLRLPHPRTHLIRTHEELSGIPAAEFGTGILKPLSSVDFARKTGVKGFLVNARDEALQLASKIEFPIMFQEFIPGPPSVGIFLDGFVDRNGRVCALFARRRLRMYPPGLGNSTLMISIGLGKVQPAVETLKALLKATAYRGIFSAEFKHDERDGRYKLFEVNARPWWYVGFAASCGVDVCSMAYRDAQGMPVESVHDYPIGRRCVLAVNDLRVWREQRRNGIGLWSWIRPWFGAEGALFHWSDPGPALAFAWQQVEPSCGRE